MKVPGCAGTRARVRRALPGSIDCHHAPDREAVALGDARGGTCDRRVRAEDRLDLGELDLHADFYAKPTEPMSGKGFGSTEAARGALSDWIVIEDGKIANYQVVTPTAWNIGPRDGSGRRHATGDAAIIDDDRLAEPLGQLAGQTASHEIGRAAGGIRHHQSQRLFRPGGLGRARQGQGEGDGGGGQAA